MQLFQTNHIPSPPHHQWLLGNSEATTATVVRTVRCRIKETEVRPQQSELLHFSNNPSRSFTADTSHSPKMFQSIMMPAKVKEEAKGYPYI
jgi:hypothetical protein